MIVSEGKLVRPGQWVRCIRDNAIRHSMLIANTPLTFGKRYKVLMNNISGKCFYVKSDNGTNHLYSYIRFVLCSAKLNDHVKIL